MALEGQGTLLLGDEEHPLAAGDVVARPAGQGVAHGIVAGEGGLTYLAFGERDTGDVIWYPKSMSSSSGGCGSSSGWSPLRYWDGEV